MANVIQEKSRDFAIKIINCYKYLNEEQHEYSQREVISNYFDTIMESVAAFVEKVTGENIREEIESRLTKKYLVVPVLMKTMNR